MHAPRPSACWPFTSARNCFLCCSLGSKACGGFLSSWPTTLSTTCRGGHLGSGMSPAVMGWVSAWSAGEPFPPIGGHGIGNTHDKSNWLIANQVQQINDDATVNVGPCDLRLNFLARSCGPHASFKGFNHCLPCRRTLQGSNTSKGSVLIRIRWPCALPWSFLLVELLLEPPVGQHHPMNIPPNADITAAT